MPQNVKFSFGNHVWEHGRYNQIQDISVTPIGAQYELLPSHEMELCSSDQIPKMLVMDTENVGGYTDKEPSFTFNPTCKPFIESCDMKPTNGGNMVDQSLKRVTFEEPDSWLMGQDAMGMDDCDDYFGFMDALDFHELNSSLPSEYSMQAEFGDGDNGVNQMEFQDDKDSEFDPSGSTY